MYGYSKHSLDSRPLLFDLPTILLSLQMIGIEQRDIFSRTEAHVRNIEREMLQKRPCLDMQEVNADCLQPVIDTKMLLEGTEVNLFNAP